MAMLEPEGELWMQGRGYGEDPWATRVWRAHRGLSVGMDVLGRARARGKT